LAREGRATGVLGPDTGYNPGSPSDAQGNGYLVQARPYPYPAEYIRGAGGTTWHWAAPIWHFLPNDFRIRSLYEVGKDWPLSYDDLEVWYYEAEVKTDVSGGLAARSRSRWSRSPK